MLPSMDAISRFIDCDDWGVSLHFSTHVNVIWGPHSVNGFANSHNFKPTSFYLRYWNAGCEGVDASCYDWVWENNWLVLLVTLIPRLSGILRIIKLRVLLSYPNWAPSRSGPCSSCSSLLTIPLSGASLLLLTLQEFLSGASPSPFSTHPSLTH